MSYLIIKWIHILCATILLGTGSGTAFQMFMAHGRRDVRAIAVVAQNIVLADWVLTVPAAVIQTVTGAILIDSIGWNPLASWLLWSYCFYFLAFACWLPVIWLQIRIRDIAIQAVDSGSPLPVSYYRYMRWWFALGWLAFTALLMVFWLMVAKSA